MKEQISTISPTHKLLNCPRAGRLQPLDDRPVSEFLNRAEVRSAADMENHATEIVNHRDIPNCEVHPKAGLRMISMVVELGLGAPTRDGARLFANP
jgi:hypothetical protein